MGVNGLKARGRTLKAQANQETLRVRVARRYCRPFLYPPYHDNSCEIVCGYPLFNVYLLFTFLLYIAAAKQDQSRFRVTNLFNHC